MENQNQPSRTLLHDIKNCFPAKEMYDMDNRNYEWESMKFAIPKKYHGDEVKHTMFKDGKVPNRKNFLDDLQRDKKKIPGPTHYKLNPNSRPLSGKISKEPRKTISQVVIEKSTKENLPGPTSYFQRPKTAMPSQSRPKSSVPVGREHYINELEYLANESPGVGSYSVCREPFKSIQGPKLKSSSSVSLIKSKESHSKSKLQSSILPGTFEWISKQKKKGDSRFFGSCKRFLTGSKYDKKPAPNSYKLKADWKSKASVDKVVTSPSSITVKNVYYA